MNPQSTGAFARNRSARSGFQNWCKKCSNALRMKRYEKHRTQELESYQRRKKADPSKFKGYRLKRTFGITLQQYEALLEHQNGSCAICKISMEAHKKIFGKDFPVDHDHKTGKIRGLLCNNCNTGIGMLKDDANLCVKAAEYLNK